jgi:hypothetical protein
MSISRIPKRLREAVRNRARGRCEYCGYPDVACYAAFNCDHCFPEASGGDTTRENLAWSCPRCNASKGGAVEAVDPQTAAAARLFNPRLHAWDQHFKWSEDLLDIVGLSPEGRATAAKLKFNREEARQIRALLLRVDLHPGKQV